MLGNCSNLAPSVPSTIMESGNDLALNFQAVTTTTSHFRNRSQEFNKERDLQPFDTRISARDPPTSPLHRSGTRFAREIELVDTRRQLLPESIPGPCIELNLSVSSSHSDRENWASWFFSGLNFS